MSELDGTGTNRDVLRQTQYELADFEDEVVAQSMILSLSMNDLMRRAQTGRLSAAQLRRMRHLADLSAPDVRARVERLIQRQASLAG